MAGAKKSPTKKSFFKAAFKHSLEAIAFLDRQERIVEINAAGCQLFGVTKKQLLNKPMSNCFLVASLAGTQMKQQGEIQIKLPKKQVKTVAYSRVPDLLTDYSLLVLRDITDVQLQKTAELDLYYQRVELFAEVTLKIRQSLQLQEILQTAVTEVQRILQADRVLIYQVFANGTGMPIEEAVLPEFKPILGVEFPQEVFPEDYRQLYAKGRVRAIANVHATDAGLAPCLIEFMDEWMVKAKLVVPILQNTGLGLDGEHLWGLLIAHQCRAPREWTGFEQELMEQLADQMGIALSQAELLENLEEIVAERTVKLRQEISERQAALRERTKAEAALRHSEEQLRLIANGLPVLIAYVDRQQHYRFNNQAYQIWLGLSPSEIADCHLLQVHGAAEYQQIEPYVALALTGETVTYERDLVLQDGCLHSLSVTYIPHIQKQVKQPAKIPGFFALTSDISDRKAIERMKDEFISVVSHELRTPLTSIHSSLKILATGKLGSLSGQGERMLEIADQQTERLVHLVNNVLDLQRIQSGKITMNKQAWQTKELMAEAVQAIKTLAQAKEIQLSFEPNNFVVWADRDYIVQTLTNLLSNAVKFSPSHSTVVLDVAKKAPRQKNNQQQSRSSSPISYITFAVKDRGQGIPSDRLETIFERFQQVDSSDSRKKGGTGLGLAICRQIVEGHGGKIWAESCLDQGSSFYFTLPELRQRESDRHD
jgi:two-component system, OmpR family, sensor histidine kinase VicK